MASRTVGLIRDQNVNVHYNGASLVGKANIATAPRKGAIGGRKPLGDLSNSVNPILNQTSKKENSKILSFSEKETSVSKLAHDSSNKKRVSKASEKVEVGGRKALSDISNSGKPRLKETSKKNQTSKLTILAENPSEPEDITKEGFLHNHDECIKAQQRATTNEFLRILGLDVFREHFASAKQHSLSYEMEPTSPSRYAKMLIEELSPPTSTSPSSPPSHSRYAKMLIEELSRPKSRKLDFCPASPEALDHCMLFEEYFQSFELKKH